MDARAGGGGRQTEVGQGLYGGETEWVGAKGGETRGEAVGDRVSQTLLLDAYIHWSALQPIHSTAGEICQLTSGSPLHISTASWLEACVLATWLTCHYTVGFTQSTYAA